MNTTCVCGGMNVHVCTCFLLHSGVTEVQEPNCCETEWSLNCNRMSVFDLSLWPYLCMSVCLRSINLQKCFNQEQHTPLIIFIHSNPPPGIIFKYDPLYCSLLPRTNDIRKLNLDAPLFSASHFSYSCALRLQSVSKFVCDDWICHLSVEHQSLNLNFNVLIFTKKRTISVPKLWLKYFREKKAAWSVVMCCLLLH